MKEQIHKHLVSLLFTVVLMLMLANCVRYKVDNPVQPASQVIEAPIVRTIRIIVAWFKGGGGGTQKGGSKSALPEPPQPK